MHANFACFGAHVPAAGNFLSATDVSLRPSHTSPAIHYDGRVAVVLLQRGEGTKQ